MSERTTSDPAHVGENVRPERQVRECCLRAYEGGVRFGLRVAARARELAAEHDNVEPDVNDDSLWCRCGDLLEPGETVCDVCALIAEGPTDG